MRGKESVNDVKRTQLHGNGMHHASVSLCCAHSWTPFNVWKRSHTHTDGWRDSTDAAPQQTENLYTMAHVRSKIFKSKLPAQIYKCNEKNSTRERERELRTGEQYQQPFIPRISTDTQQQQQKHITNMCKTLYGYDIIKSYQNMGKK